MKKSTIIVLVVLIAALTFVCGKAAKQSAQEAMNARFEVINAIK